MRPPTDRTNTIFLFAPNLRTGYVQQYSLTLQREVFRNTVVEAAYVGTHGIKLFMDLNLNQPRIYEDFLAAFRELQAFRASGTPVSASNTLVRIFGTTAAAITSIGSNVIDQGAVGSAADSLDRTNYSRYAAAGVSDFYLRNFPQFNQLVVGTNDGRSYYNSFQLSMRRQAGALKFVANYTFSKSMDNITVEGNGFTSPIDNFNVRLNRARGDFDIPHAFNSSFIYTLPIGKGRRFAGHAPRWVDSALGGWDVGLLAMWQSGRVLTYLSGRATGPTTNSSYVNYAGDRNVGRVMRKGDGVYWLTPEEIGRFSYPVAGEIGTGGRNAFRGPRFFDVDMSLVKKFKDHRAVRGLIPRRSLQPVQQRRTSPRQTPTCLRSPLSASSPASWATLGFSKWPCGATFERGSRPSSDLPAALPPRSRRVRRGLTPVPRQRPGQARNCGQNC